MARRLVILAILVTASGVVPQRVIACGDKYASSPRMYWEKANRAKHPGSVVLYVPPGVAKRSSYYADVRTLLTRVGHKVTLVTEAEGAARAAGTADIFVADLPNAAIINPASSGSPKAAWVFAVLDQATKANVASCKAKNYSDCSLKNGDKPERFVVAINAKMDARAKALKANP